MKSTKPTQHKLWSFLHLLIVHEWELLRTTDYGTWMGPLRVKTEGPKWQKSLKESSTPTLKSSNKPNLRVKKINLFDDDIWSSWFHESLLWRKEARKISISGMQYQWAKEPNRHGTYHTTLAEPEHLHDEYLSCSKWCWSPNHNNDRQALKSATDTLSKQQRGNSWMKVKNLRYLTRPCNRHLAQQKMSFPMPSNMSLSMRSDLSS